VDCRRIQPQRDQLRPDQAAQAQSRAIRPSLDMDRRERAEAAYHGVHHLLTDPVAALPDRRTDRCQEFIWSNAAREQPLERLLNDPRGSAAPSGVDRSQRPAVPRQQQQRDTIRAPDRRREVHPIIREGQQTVGLDLAVLAGGSDHARAMNLMRVEESSPLQTGCAQHPRTPLGIAVHDKGTHVECSALLIDGGREDVPDATDVECAAADNLEVAARLVGPVAIDQRSITAST